jgi:transposase
MYYTGIDLHKSFSHLTTVDEKGVVVEQQKIYNHPDKIIKYFQRLGDTHKAVVESTNGWYWIADLLHGNGIEMVLANTNKLKAISTAKIKTDQIDSTTMAQLLRIDYIPEAHQIDPVLRDKRDLMRARLRMIQRKTCVMNSVCRLMEKFNVTDPDDLPGFYQFQYQQLDKHINFLNDQIKELEKTIYPQVVFNEDVQRILWIPGIGKISAFTIFLEVGDFSRFPTEKQFFSYSRVVPAASNSGGKCKHGKKESKAGNNYLKIVFNDAAVCAYTNYPEVRDFYQRKCRKKNKHLARNLVAKELARIVYHVITKKSDYDFTFKGKKLTRVKVRHWPSPTSPGTVLDPRDPQ